MDHLSNRDADLNPTTRGYLDELSAVTGTSKVALLELSVALLYRQFFRAVQERTKRWWAAPPP